MIYTVTFSPAIDYVIYMDDLKQGETNRSKNETYYFGGKGINVSTVLGHLEVENTALGFVSGFTGKALEDGLKEAGLVTDFIHLEEGITRINIKIKSGKETEINTQGAAIPAEKLEELLHKLDKLTKGDTLVISGNIPSTLPKDIYQVMLQRLKGKEIRFVVDATGDLLKHVLSYRPFFVKPNKAELEELTGRRIRTAENLAQSAKELQEAGARNVIVSLGAEGAYLLCEDGTSRRLEAIQRKAINTVGAGDSLVAGFLAGYLKTSDPMYALRLGVAAGSATACSEGLAEKDKILEFLGKC